MRYEIFVQATGRTVYTARWEWLARALVACSRRLDYAEQGAGW